MRICALNTKILFTKFGSPILTFESAAISINIQNYDMISRLYVVIRRNTRVTDAVCLSSTLSVLHGNHMIFCSRDS